MPTLVAVAQLVVEFRPALDKNQSIRLNVTDQPI